MKKLNLVFVFSLLFIISCKSLPEAETNKVKALDLIDGKSSFYLSVPSDVDNDLVQRLIKMNVSNISDSDVKSISDRIDSMYIGLNKQRNKTTIQAAVNSNIPRKYIPTLLSKKKGWDNTSIKFEGPATEYKIYSQNGIDLAFPSDNILCLGRNTDFMLGKYHEIYNYQQDELEPLPDFSELNEDIYNWLEGSDTEIRFYTVQPQTYLTSLLGTNLDLSLISVYGSFKVDPEHSDMYLLDFVFNFKSSFFAKTGKTLLGIAFGLSNGEIDTPTNTCIKISGIQLKKSQIYKLLVL